MQTTSRGGGSGRGGGGGQKAGVVILVALIGAAGVIIAAFVGAWYQSQHPIFAQSNATVVVQGPTITQTSLSTSVSTTTATSVSTQVSTVTSTSTSVVTTTTTSTLQVPIPDPINVTLAGKATTRTLGSTAVKVGFVDEKGRVYQTDLVNGNYSISLPNQHVYTAQVQYTPCPSFGQCWSTAVIFKLAITANATMPLRFDLEI